MKVRIAVYGRNDNRAVATIRTPEKILWTSKEVPRSLVATVVAAARREAEARRYEIVKAF